MSDKFNYTLARPMAKVLASVLPGARAVEFPMPEDWHRVEGALDQRRFAFVWMDALNEKELTEDSRILTISGKMRAGDWLLEERCRLEQACFPDPPENEDYCHRVLKVIAMGLPWMRSIFPNSPVSWEWSELFDTLDDVQEILSGDTSSLTIETVAHENCWETLARQRRFAFDDDAQSLGLKTPQPNAPHKKIRRV